MKKSIPLALCAILPAFACGATLTVTSTGDDASDPATLRGAIAAAADGDTIMFDSSLAGATISLVTANGPLEYSGSLTIEGPASAPVTIDGGGAAADASGLSYKGSTMTTYLVHATGASATTTLKNLVFTGSKAMQTASAPDVGPAVSILGNAVIDNCCWTNNGTERSGNFGRTDGGGCLRVVGDLTLTDSTFTDNGARGNYSRYSQGGAILAKGANVTIRNCTIRGTTGWDGDLGIATDGGAVGLEAGVANLLV